MDRLPDWGARVRRTIREWERKTTNGAVEWGVDDCIQLGVAISVAIYGYSLWPEMENSYRSYARGYAVMVAAYGGLFEALDRRCVRRISSDEARLGDFAVSDDFFSGAPVVHVYLRRGHRVTFSAKGMEVTNLRPISAAWRL